MTTPTPCEEVATAARFGAYGIVARPLLLKVLSPGDRGRRPAAIHLGLTASPDDSLLRVDYGQREVEGPWHEVQGEIRAQVGWCWV